MKLIFSENAWQDYHHWRDHDAIVFERLNALIKETKRTPFKGIGKPEALKGDLSGWWSRRITKADRLVYRLSGSGENQALEIAQCRYHY